MQKIKILIVDDELLIQERIARHLEIMGFEVSGKADRGKEAIKMINSNKPDLILMDIELKENMTGIDVAKIINEKWQIPIIFLTSFTDSRTIHIASQTNPANFLGKPYTPRNLRIAIDLALAKVGQHFGESKALLQMKDSFFVRNKDCYQKILVENILFIEAANSSCLIVTHSSKKYVISTNLTKLTYQFSPSVLNSCKQVSYCQ